MILNEASVAKARETIEFKKPYIEKIIKKRFDKDGRVILGNMPSYSKDTWREVFKDSITKEFADCFEEGLKSLGLEPFSINRLTFEQCASKRIKVIRKGREQEKSIASLLQKAHDIWEKRMDIYRPLRKHMKELRDEGGGMALGNLSTVLKNFEKGNAYMAYDSLLRNYQEKDVILSINPLDKLFASGGPGTNEYTITKFNTCWSNIITKGEREGVFNVGHLGCYSNHESQIALGEHLCGGMIIVKNGNELKVGDMTFYGMLERSHVWIDDNGLFIEDMYPDKHNHKKVKEIEALFSTSVKINKPTEWQELKISYDSFDEIAWGNNFLDSISRGGRLIYLDRAGIDLCTKKISLSHSFRYGNYGGSHLKTGSGRN